MTLFAEPEGTTERAFESFAAGCSTRLIRAAYLLCGDHQIAEDLLQMTMLRTARRWRVARSAPEAYARAVLVNLARDRRVRGDGDVLHQPCAVAPARVAHRAARER